MLAKLAWSGIALWCVAASGCAATTPAEAVPGSERSGATEPLGIASRPVRSFSASRRPAGVGAVRRRAASRSVEPTATADGVVAATDVAAVIEERSAPAPPGFAAEVVAPGEGEAVRPGARVVIRFRGAVEGGEVFQDVDKPRGPWPVDALVPGLARGLQGMAVGGTRRITIPPELGYGDRPVTDPATGRTLVPPGSTLVYEVELVGVENDPLPETHNEADREAHPEATEASGDADGQAADADGAAETVEAIDADDAPETPPSGDPVADPAAATEGTP